MLAAVVRLLGVGLLLGPWAGAQELPFEHTIEKIASGYQYVGGMAWSHDGRLYFSDTPRGEVHVWTPGQPAKLLPVKLASPAGLACDERGRLLVCEAGARRIVRVKADNALETLANVFEGKKLNAPRDVIVRKDGTVYFTDPAFGSAADAMETPFHGLYRLSGKGEAVAVARWNTRPGGIAFSPDGKTLYAAMSDERTVRALDLDRQGNASNERTLIHGLDGVPNAVRVDEQGRLFVAARTLAVYSPEGQRLGQIEMSERPVSLAFGEAGGRVLFIGTHTSIYRVDFAPRR